MSHQIRHPKIYSCEFFPPKTDEAAERLQKVQMDLCALGLRFLSVTYGAGGSTQARTLNTVLAIQRDSGIDAAPHLSCVGSTREHIRETLHIYRNHGIRHLVALRGDLPSGMHDIGEFRYANELVAFIREETGDHFHIEVAAYPEIHPQARSAEDDLRHFKLKVDAGADSAITQYFYNADAYFRFVDECERMGLDLPVVPGIMPITNYTQLARFSDACGAEIPRWVRKRLEGYGDDRDSIRAFGLDVVTALCERLLAGGAPGLHFYTMNQSEATLSLWQRLGLPMPAT
ncbi:methylenetetrahydrofolate reductase [NAD(P)H] [Acidihalobacter yilgarnensis]|uniref:Methylenetetrahydrofolate reductase n=1 Tax=Acidihalobacter yilgarnensis TaxID=2819280 RepID=A0A1D8IK65_9GAMM|nr:methylenetetrahydrofolate reductase [NAD(P)H] [Acidihalobacter yilgarnensis]AOU96845.1 methylenetetrahydrofolate reductase [NAD(P)H] [Acidihalobacter yilgarnensis]